VRVLSIILVSLLLAGAVAAHATLLGAQITALILLVAGLAYHRLIRDRDNRAT
jgi:uncharacterized membrane protein